MTEIKRNKEKRTCYSLRNPRYSAVKKQRLEKQLTFLTSSEVDEKKKIIKREKMYLNTAIYHFFKSEVVFQMLLSWFSFSFAMMQSRSTENPSILKFSKVIRKQ